MVSMKTNVLKGKIITSLLYNSRLDGHNTTLTLTIENDKATFRLYYDYDLRVESEKYEDVLAFSA